MTAPKKRASDLCAMATALQDKEEGVEEIITRWRLSFSLGNAVHAIVTSVDSSPETAMIELRVAVGLLQQEIAYFEKKAASA